MTSFFSTGVIFRLLASFINNSSLLVICLALMLMSLDLLSFFYGIGDANKLFFLQLTGFSEGPFPLKYLGVPLSPYRLLASQYFPLLHKMESFIQSWLGNHLSYAGRIELIRSVLQGMV
jgi:hypothetical protein